MANYDAELNRDKESKSEAGYLGPEHGPFYCHRCIFFVKHLQPCEKVQGPIDRHGCCDYFKDKRTHG